MQFEIIITIITEMMIIIIMELIIIYHKVHYVNLLEYHGQVSLFNRNIGTHCSKATCQKYVPRLLTGILSLRLSCIPHYFVYDEMRELVMKSC